jgi:UDP-glucose 4-epimerase
METILVTGGAGYIGSVVAELLVSRGYPTLILDNLRSGHREAVPDGARLIETDLNDRAALDRVFAEEHVSAVVHMAAAIEVEESVRRPLFYYRENVGGTLTLLETMVAAGVKRIVFSSTAAVYGRPEKTPIREDDPTVPVNPYGQTKLVCEQMLEAARQAEGMRYVALRYFNASGATRRLGENHVPESHLIPRLLAAAAGRAPAIHIYGTDYPTTDGTCIRDYIHVLDIAEAHLTAIENASQGGAVYNLGSGHGYSVRQVIETAERVVGHHIPVEVHGRRAGDPPALVADSSRIRSDLGWEPKRNLEEILRSAWEWAEAHPQGYSA